MASPVLGTARKRQRKQARALLLAIAVAAVLPACSPAPRPGYVTPAWIERSRDLVLARFGPVAGETLEGGVLLRDGAPVSQAPLALARAVLRTNDRIAPAYALLLAVATARAACHAGLPPEFLGATLLQESAYDDQAVSSAGAEGIAQFMPATAAGVGIDPYDPFAAIGGAAELLASYVAGYRGRYADPYAAALAAYNAGPGAVAAYGGVPPYPQTRAYVATIFDRWARIVSYERMRPRWAKCAFVEENR